MAYMPIIGYQEDTPHVSGDMGFMALGVRQLADTAMTDTDGDYAPLKLDEEGRVKVATKPASFALVTGQITAISQSVVCDVSRASNVMIHVIGGGTGVSASNATFYGSLDSTTGADGSWFIIQVIRSNANTIETTSGALTLGANASNPYAWEASVNGLTFVKITATAHGSGTAVWKFQRGSYATEPIPGAQVTATQPVSGTVTASNCTGSIAHSTATSGNPVFVGGTVVTTVDTTLVSNDRAQLPITSGQQVIIKPYASSELAFTYSSAIGTPLTSTTSTALKAASGASIRNYLVGLQVINTAATTGQLSILDGTTVIWTTWMPASMTQANIFDFTIPLKTTANAALNIQANVGMTLYISAQGYQGF